MGPADKVLQEHSVSVSPTPTIIGIVDKPAVNFSRARKAHVIAAGLIFAFNTLLGATLPSGAVTAITKTFNVTSAVQPVLLTSLYLCGFAIGPLIWGPLSEHFGRRPIIITSFTGYIVFTLGCALAPNYPALLIFRLLCGINAACPNSVVNGMFADIFDDARNRGRSVAVFLFLTGIAPFFSPIISGFASTTIGWRWSFWVALIFASASYPLALTMPETFPGVLNKREAQSNQIDHTSIKPGRERLWQSKTVARDVGRVLTRPYIMILSDPVLASSALYMALIYSIYFLFFQAYPIVFQNLYGLSPGIAGLAFLPSAVGMCISFAGFFWYGSFHAKAKKSGASWAHKEDYHRLPLACIGAPLTVIGLFWLGWLSRPGVHPIVPMLAGLFFGSGYLLIFLAMINYITDRYTLLSASALGAASTIRSIFAVALPLATRPMYGNLGIAWASSLLGFIAMAMGVIPFVFIKYGDWLRRHQISSK